MSMAHEEKDFSTRWREEIEGWLQEEGWQVGHETSPQARWVLTLRDAQGRPLGIAHTNAGKDQLSIELGLALDQPSRALIAQLAPGDRRALIFDLHEAFILLGVQYGGVGEPLREFAVQSVCYLDGLTKNELMGRIRRVRDAGMLAIDKISRALDQPPPEQPANRPLGFQLGT